MIEKSTTTIGEREFEFTPLQLRPARSAFLKLAKLLGPGIAELARGHAATGSSAEGAAGAVAAIIQALDEPTLDFFVGLFTKQTKVRWETGIMVDLTEAVFGGDLMQQFRWLYWCLECQYGDFLGGDLVNVLRGLGTTGAAASASTSPKA